MSTANFDSRQLGFPLYVHDDLYAKVCPECGAWCDPSEPECWECGASLADADVRYDELGMEDLYDCVTRDLKDINSSLLFFDVSVKSGYYAGMQLDVNWKKIGWMGVAGDPEELDNDDAHFYFDCCRSEMLRKYEREQRKLGKALKELADSYGFEEIVCVGVFSNGEAVYERAGTVRAAACAI